MSWVKQSDTLWRDYEFNRLSDGAQALWHRANSYIADQLTDGLIPPDAIKLLQTRKRYVDELVAAGRWVWQPAGGWLAAGWQEFIESRDRVLARRSESIQRANKSRAAHVRERCAPPGPGPGPGPQFFPEEEEKKLGALSLSETAPANDRARDRSARFEKPPLGEAPAELPPPERKPDPWLRVWELYADHIGLDVFQLPHASTQERALRAIAASAEVEAGGSQGVGFENAVKRLLGAWKRDKWVQEKQPSIANLAGNLHRYAAPKQPIVKLAPQPADSLMDHWDRIERSKTRAQRRQEQIDLGLVPDDEFIAVGGAS